MYRFGTGTNTSDVTPSRGTFGGAIPGVRSRLPEGDWLSSEVTPGGAKSGALARSGPAQREGNGQAGAGVAAIHSGDAAVMRDDDLLHQGEPEPGASRFRREKRRKDFPRRSRLDARSVVRNRNPENVVGRLFDAVNRNPGRHVRLGACLERIAAQIAERLPEEDLVPFDPAEPAGHGDVAAPGPGVGADFLRGPVDDALHFDRRQRQVRGLGEVQEICHHLPESLGLVANALYVRP